MKTILFLLFPFFVFAQVKTESIQKKYTRYVIEQLTRKSPDDIHKNYQKHMSVTASVERSSENELDVYELGDTLTWTSKYPAKISIINLFEDPLYEIIIKDTSYILSQLPFFEKEKTVLLVIQTGKLEKRLTLKME